MTQDTQQVRQERYAEAIRQAQAADEITTEIAPDGGYRLSYRGMPLTPTSNPVPPGQGSVIPSLKAALAAMTVADAELAEARSRIRSLVIDLDRHDGYTEAIRDALAALAEATR